VVDDASTDRSPDLVRRAAADDPRIKVIRHPVNRKLGGSLKTGFAAASKGLVLYMDADLRSTPRTSGRAIRALELTRADMIAGYRLDRTTEGWLRTVYSYLYNFLIGVLFGWPHRDINFSFKLMRREVIEAIELRSEGSLIDAELVVKAKNLGSSSSRSASTTSAVARPLHALLAGRHLQDAGRDGGAFRRHAPPAAPPSLRRQGSRRSLSRFLVVTADDVGLHAGMTDGAIEAHARGIVTACSVVPAGRDFARAAGRLREHPSLAVGAHLTLVGARPLSPPVEVPSLVGRDGALLPGFGAFLRRYYAGSIDPGDVERELRRQIEALLAAGLKVSHANGHQHLHVLPRVHEVVLRLPPSTGSPTCAPLWTAGHPGPSHAAARGRRARLLRKGRASAGSGAGHPSLRRRDDRDLRGRTPHGRARRGAAPPRAGGHRVGLPPRSGGSGHLR